MPKGLKDKLKMEEILTNHNATKDEYLEYIKNSQNSTVLINNNNLIRDKEKT